MKGFTMFKYVLVLVASVIFVSSPSFAMSKADCGGDCVTCHSLTEKDANEILKKTGINVKSVKQSPSRGLFELLVEKDSKQGVIYIDYGKKNLLQGMIVNLETLQPVSAHSQDLPQPKQITSVDVSKIPADKAVILGNPKGTKKLYVFTDPDCPYCQKGHVELKKLAKIAPDVAIHIMLYPLPMHPGAYDKARTVLETMNLDLLDKAFEGKEVPKPAKESSRKSIDEIIAFANANGISGTPTMVMPDGKIEVGMRDAETLKKMLEAK
jgi:thiol:disulfide interchange protein DsbC